jgi:pentatricopeptide repeat domain-containing protein 1
MDRQFLYLVAGLPMMLAVEAQFDTSLLNCRPSVVAAALLYAERRQRGAVPFWPSMLAKLTGYEDLTTPELACAVKSAQKLCRKAHYMQLYKTQSAQLAAQLMGLPAASQPQAQLGSVPAMQVPALLGQQGLEQAHSQQQTVRLASGMQADAVVAAPQLNRAPSVSLPPSGLGLQPSLSGPLSTRALSASSSGSSALGMGVLTSAGGACCITSGAPGALGLRGNSALGPSMVPAMQGPTMQQNQVDLALLAQLQFQQAQQEQQRQQQQQQASSLAALSAAGLLGPGMQLGGGNYGLDLNQSMQQAGLYSAANNVRTGCFVGGGNVGSLNGYAAQGVPPFSISLQTPILQQPLQQAQDQQDVAGLENLAMTLSALGLHGTADGQINTAALEAVLRQQC